MALRGFSNELIPGMADVAYCTHSSLIILFSKLEDKRFFKLSEYFAQGTISIRAIIYEEDHQSVVACREGK